VPVQSIFFDFGRQPAGLQQFPVYSLSAFKSTGCRVGCASYSDRQPCVPTVWWLSVSLRFVVV